MWCKFIGSVLARPQIPGPAKGLHKFFTFDFCLLTWLDLLRTTMHAAPPVYYFQWIIDLTAQDRTAYLSKSRGTSSQTHWLHTTCVQLEMWGYFYYTTHSWSHTHSSCPSGFILVEETRALIFLKAPAPLQIPTCVPVSRCALADFKLLYT